MNSKPIFIEIPILYNSQSFADLPLEQKQLMSSEDIAADKKPGQTSINVDYLVSFNVADDPKKTTIRLANGQDWIVDLDYQLFRMVLDGAIGDDNE